MAKKHIVRAGECISSIAFDHGLFWETVWNHPGNSALVKLRKDPNVVRPGDEVELPDLAPREEDGATEQRHRFKVKGVRATLHLRLMRQVDPEGQDKEPAPVSTSGRSVTSEDPESETESQEDEPRSNVPYIVDIDGRITEGKTDDDGRIEIGIPPNAKRGKLIVEPGTPNETVTPLQLGALDPISEISGVSQRLANLGLGCEPVDEMTPELEAALVVFQKQQDLEVTGEIDDATRQKLEALHDS